MCVFVEAPTPLTSHSLSSSSNDSHPPPSTQVAVPGGLVQPVDRSVREVCNLLGCKTCLPGSESRTCQRCKDGWQLTPEGKCECAVGSGTYVTTAFETSLPYPGFTSTQPADACLYRNDNPTYLSPLRRVEHCIGANPRVLQNFFVDPSECECRACPAGWTSAGGPPKVCDGARGLIISAA